MKHKIKANKLTFFLFFLAFGSTMSVNSCKSGGDDPTPDPITPVTTDEMYIIFNGQKVKCKVPATIYRTINNSIDTVVTWSGNIPSGFGGDTTINISHFGPRIHGMKYKPAEFGVDNDQVIIYLRWGIIAGQPWVLFDGGDYTIEKVKGKWVSTMKNGTGFDSKDKTKRYSNIEFRIIWP